jgi:hypothetical protein
VFSVCRLLSRRCHHISSIPQLNSCPSQNRTSGFPIHPAPRVAIQRAAALRHGFRSMRMRGVGHPTRPRARTRLSVSGRFPADCHSLHSVNVSLSRSSTRGDLRSAGVSRFFAMPLRPTGPHHSRRGPPPPSFYIGRSTRGLQCDLAPRASVRRSPGYLPVFEQLDAVLDPGVSVPRSSLSRSPLGLRPHGEDRHVPKSCRFSGLCVRFRAPPFTSLLSLVLLPAFRFQSLRY